MKLAMIIVTAINILFLLCYFVIHKKRIKNDVINVIYPFETAGPIVLFFSWFMCAIMLWTYTKSEATIYTMLPCSIMGLFMVLPYFTMSLRYDENGFEYRNGIGIKYKAAYADVKGIRTDGSFRIFFRNHAFTLANGDPKIKLFLDKLERDYVAATGRGVKKSPTFKAKKDPLNGNKPGSWIIFIVFIAAACISLFSSAKLLYSAAVNSTESIKTYFYFVNYTYTDAILSAGDYEEFFIIKDYESYGDQFKYFSYYTQGDTYDLTVCKYGEDYLILTMTGEDGTVYISEEDTAEYYNNQEQRYNIFGGVFLIFASAYFIFGIFVMRDPEQYSDWIRKLFRVDEKHLRKFNRNK